MPPVPVPGEIEHAERSHGVGGKILDRMSAGKYRQLRRATQKISWMCPEIISQRQSNKNSCNQKCGESTLKHHPHMAIFLVAKIFLDREQICNERQNQG